MYWFLLNRGFKIYYWNCSYWLYFYLS